MHGGVADVCNEHCRGQRVRHRWHWPWPARPRQFRIFELAHANCEGSGPGGEGSGGKRASVRPTAPKQSETQSPEG